MEMSWSNNRNAWSKSKTLKYEKHVMQDDESEKVTETVYLYQLLIYLYNLQISIEISLEKLT